MSEPLDGWARWLHKERFGGDETVARNLLAQLGQLRDRILRSARLKAGEVFLDVGCATACLDSALCPRSVRAGA